MIFDEFIAGDVSPEDLDILLSKGFRHFGMYFFRYEYSILNEQPVRVLPLRINLSKFKLSKNQKKILKKNSDLKGVFNSASVTREKEELFEIHKKRFKENIPESIYSYLSEEPATVPCRVMEFAVYDGDRLAAISFFDFGEKATSSIYAMFHPDYDKRSLGIYTMLKEILFSIENGLDYLYPGYAYRESSFYDYKKRFSALEYYNWDEEWLLLKDESIAL